MLVARREGAPLLEGSGIGVLEDSFDRPAEHTCDAERKAEGRNVAAFLQENDGLASASNPIGELLLGHLAVLEAEPADVIGDRGFRH